MASKRGSFKGRFLGGSKYFKKKFLKYRKFENTIRYF
jgi:hypothetical protein